MTFLSKAVQPENKPYQGLCQPAATAVRRAALREFLQYSKNSLFDTKRRIKSISGPAILQIDVILKPERLHRSFRKSCPA